MLILTKQQRLVICVVIFLLLTGWVVKAYRHAHPKTGLKSQSVA